ncbi:Cell division cycle-associated 7-like protein [Geodia barretti]|uniref:Cell division cycle-associated 7-like protein n=1 Tax=Geodia barretti TaxID=519541 RepID=A0AA35SQK0_GEOBA|nr:Cell division cycle-associated 7-like protein [Geodia barretti]
MPPKRASMRVSNQQKATGELYKSLKTSAALSGGGKQRKGTACSREQKSEIGGKTGKSKKEGERKGVGRGQSQSCHQCRQSIHSNKGVSEVKSGRERIKCSTCTRFWCEQCLLNRYGIVKETVAVVTWVCPVCSNKCNCSLCRRKEGKLATGILTPLAKVAGFESVSDFLTEGTNDIAKILQWQSNSQPVSSRSAERNATKSETTSPKTVSRKRRGAPTTSPSSLTPQTHQSTKPSIINLSGKPASTTTESTSTTDSAVHSSHSPPSHLPSPFSPTSPSSSTELFVWRSSRRRILTQRFSAGDYSDAPQHKNPCRENDGIATERRRSKRERRLSERENGEPQKEVGEFNEGEWLEKQGELEDLRKLQLLNLKSEHERWKQLEREYRQKEKERAREERERVREEREGLKRMARDISKQFNGGHPPRTERRTHDEVKPLVEEKKNEDKSLQQEYRLSILEQLTTVALDMPDVSTAIEVATVTAYQAKVEGRVRERERTKSISEDLRGLASVKEIQQKRREIMEQLAAIRRDSYEREYSSLVVVRNTCLGEDRLSRRYWRLQSLPGVVVQEDCCPAGNNGDCTTESGEKWLLVGSHSLLISLMEGLQCVHPKEHELLSNLRKLYSVITKSLPL